MKITCPACAQPIAGADIDLASRRAVCRPCSELIFLPAALAVAPRAAAVDHHRPVGMVASESEERGCFSIGFRAQQRTAIARTIGGLPFGLLFSAIAMLFFSIHEIAAWGAVFAVVATAGFALAGLGIAGLRHTGIALGAEGLRYDPPVGRGLALPLAALRGFAAALMAGRSTWAWGLRVFTIDNQSLLLPLELPLEEQARSLAARLNRALEEARTPQTYRG
jgi:hypothetical protein